MIDRIPRRSLYVLPVTIHRTGIFAAPFGAHGSSWKRRISGSTFNPWFVPSSL
ncbi:hypothetical protein GGR90_003887 [Sphingopyxis italica]|uniref:Uncharacterized protein n=1 Tax=Sphingopyxis italica TaxID=1129133 RepID=A0A7X6BB19_9SPHN|nr:hypothetical protein [Sphingopyxis italica]NJB91666.1 hypothetical protein [Sphingopyxis italica]